MIHISAKEHKQTKQGSSKGSKTDATAKDLEATKDQLLRLQAEFANFQKRTSAELAQSYQRGICDALKGFINVFDDFELALKNDATSDQFKRGMELIYAKFISAAEELGLKRIETRGKQFDPNEHEALLVQDSDRPSQEVLEELQAGYKKGETVIRTAKVKVAK